jgi:hypothetical protein
MEFSGQFHTMAALSPGKEKQGSSVSMATRLQAGQSGFDSQQEQGRGCFLHPHVQTNSEAHSASYPIGTGDTPSRAEVKDAWRYISFPNTSSWHGA